MPVTSPFKFLDAYHKEDKDIFFGRDDEVEQLYQLVFESNLTLIYGQSGTGKTSLVQCGLANRFIQSDWFNVYIRRNENINQSLLASLQKFGIKESQHRLLAERIRQRRRAAGTATVPTAAPAVAEENDLLRTLRSLYKHYLKPVYLIFDQFEELFILGSRAEQQEFYHSIARILETESYCRVIIIMREESIAQLYDFEKVVPHLFEKRLRVERMSRARTEEVITRTTGRFDIQLADPAVPGKIIDVLSEGHGRVELTYLQVFLDRLYQEAVKRSTDAIRFDPELILQTGSIEDVLGDFLNRQTTAIQRKAEQQFTGLPSSGVSKVLSAFVTLEGTKRPVTREQIKAGRLTDPQTGFIVEELERNRILRYEDDRYELAHDALALQVANARTADEVAILQIAQIIRNRHQEYDATQSLLNANELQLIKSYRKRLEEEELIADEQWQFVQKSAAADRRRRISVIIMVALVMVTLAVFALYSNLQARQIKDSLVKLEAAQSQEKAANYQKFLSDGNAQMALNNYQEAIDAYQNALRFDPEGPEARQNMQQAKDRSQSQGRFDDLIARGDELFAKSSDNPALLVNAREAYRQARETGYNSGEADLKISQVEAKLATAFEDFKSAGDGFFEAGENSNSNFQYELALESYRQAARIEPDDKYIQKQIRQCERKLE